MAEEEFSAVVADNGNGTCNTEFAGDDAPRVKLPSIIDGPKMPGIMVDTEQKDSNVGDEGGRAHSPHVCKFLLRMLGYVHGGQPTVILREFQSGEKVNAWICAQRATDRDVQSFCERLDMRTAGNRP